MAKKNKTQETEVNVADFVNSYVDNDQKKADSFQLIELLQKWSGFAPKMWGLPSLVLEATITNTQVVMRAMLLSLDSPQERPNFPFMFS